MTTPLKCTALMTAMLLGTALASCSSDTETTASPDNVSSGDACAPELASLDFGVISTESQENLKAFWEPLLALMAEEIDRDVKGFYATDYAGVVEAMGAGKIQIAWYGGKSYVEAAKRSEAEAFAQHRSRAHVGL